MRCLTAAQGWVELGDFNSAYEETEEISHEHKNHPEVLHFRFYCFLQAKKFDACHDVGLALTKIAPNWTLSWLAYCNAIHWLGDSEKAYKVLHPISTEHPKDWGIKYDLACYAAQTDRIEEARTLLEAALDLCPDANRQKLIALEDPDLGPLWQGK